MPVQYQPASSLYCVRAVYKLKDASNPMAGVNVYNSAKSGSVTGAVQGGGMVLSAVPAEPGSTSPTAASKLKVGPSFLPTSFDGPYWVAAAAPDFSWVVVVGGAPTKSAAGGCRTAGGGPFSRSGDGLWLFARKPDDAAATAAARKAAAALGLDLSVLLPVQQKGCTYPAV